MSDNAKILVVSQNEGLGQEIGLLLGGLAEVVWVGSSNAALVELSEETFQTIMVDLDLPTHLDSPSGCESMVLVGLLAEHHRLDVIALADAGDPESQKLCWRAGAREVLARQTLTRDCLMGVLFIGEGLD